MAMVLKPVLETRAARDLADLPWEDREEVEQLVIEALRGQGVGRRKKNWPVLSERIW